MSLLNEEQAYGAMYYFLKRIWERNHECGLGDLMSDISLLPDGDPADIAIKGDWRNAIDFALAGGKAESLTFQESEQTEI